MKILFLVDVVPYPPNTGHKIRTFNIIRQLYNDGQNEIFLLCFNQQKLIANRADIERYASALHKYCRDVFVFDIPSDRNRYTYYKCLFKNLFQTRPYRAERYMSDECRQAIIKVMHENSIDLVHLDKTELYGYASLFGDTPVVCTNHNVESLLMLRRSRREVGLSRKIFAWLQYLKTRRYEKSVLGRVAGYLTCTDIDGDYFRQQLGIRTSHATIDNGVDVDHYQADGRDGDYLLIIGAQNRESTANFDATRYFMKQIWPLIDTKHPGVSLLIAGRNPDESVLDCQRVAGNIKVLGFVEDERPTLANAKALLVPLRVGGGSRLKILTAMAMGRVVISTSIGAEGIACTDGKNILIADEPETFARQVDRVLNDKLLRQRIGSAARELAEQRYDWNRIGERLRKYYAGIVNRE